MALVVESGRFDCLCWGTSNTLKSGYGTVLTAACARQGCSASDLVWFVSYYDHKVSTEEKLVKNE
jgi:hypothetical protein